jgi:AraC-like DNA-binding protein
MKAKGIFAYDYAESLRYEPYRTDHLVDAVEHRHSPFEPEFPFAIYSFAYNTLKPEVRLTRHNWLELFLPVRGYGSFRVGERIFDFAAGDILAVDNMRLHGADSFEGPERHAVVIYFKEELFYNLGSALCDFGYLAPFYGLTEETDPILRTDHRGAPAIHAALDRLFKCWLDAPRDQYFKIGCKTYLSEILYLLSRGLGASELARAEYLHRREQAQRLGVLIEYLNHNYSDKITVPQAAALVGMSQSHFIRFFKQAAGMTFVDYLTHLRVAKARQLLCNRNLSIAEVSNLVGFSDQSYFDKRFKERFGKPPREYRARAESL